jgi:hypothetical protein
MSNIFTDRVLIFSVLLGYDNIHFLHRYHLRIELGTVLEVRVATSSYQRGVLLGILYEYINCVNQKFCDQSVYPHAAPILHFAVVFLCMIRGGNERHFHSLHHEA